jgi:hypothetical protein
MFLLFKERRPFKLKKEHPSEQWQIISFRLIPLTTPVSFRWTVPLSESAHDAKWDQLILPEFAACGVKF